MYEYHFIFLLRISLSKANNKKKNITKGNSLDRYIIILNIKSMKNIDNTHPSQDNSSMDAGFICGTVKMRYRI